MGRMESGTLALADFLLARIAEDEAKAKSLIPQISEPGGLTVEDVGRAGLVVIATPARVLAECDAKRRIMSLHRQYDWPGCDGNEAHGREDCETLRLLALPYADHPDYRDEWRL